MMRRSIHHLVLSHAVTRSLEVHHVAPMKQMIQHRLTDVMPRLVRFVSNCHVTLPFQPIGSLDALNMLTNRSRIRTHDFGHCHRAQRLVHQISEQPPLLVSHDSP